MEDERDIKRHFVNGVDVLEVPTVTISRAWSLESGSGSDETGTGAGTETGSRFHSHPESDVLHETHGTTSTDIGGGGIHTRKSFENP